MVKKITVQDIEDVVGFEVSDNVKALINDFDLTYRELSQPERDSVILNIINTLNDDIEYVGKHRLEKWENGWYENLELLKQMQEKIENLRLEDYKFNRLILFDTNIFHLAGKGLGDSIDNSKLTMQFQFYFKRKKIMDFFSKKNPFTYLKYSDVSNRIRKTNNFL